MPRAAARAVRARRRAVRGAARPTGSTGWSSRRCRSGSTRPSRRVDMLAEKTPAGVRRLRPAGAGRRVVRRPPVRRAPRRAGGGARRPDRSLLPDPHDDRPRGGRGVVPPVRGRRARRRGRQAARARRTSQNARTMLKIKHERTADVVVAGLPRAQDLARPSGRCSAACCSACTPTASCSTSASAPASPRPGAPS